MDLNPDHLYFIPLGGSEQFGVNLNVYAYGGKLLIVDCGLGFADDSLPGIDLVVPDPSFLEDRRDDILALIITHAHEDHIGATAHLWPELDCPVYCSAFTAEILKRKFDEHNVKNAKIHKVKPLQTIKRKPFEIQFIPVAHSVPDTMALFISTAQGTVVHSGDWNLDPKPALGPITDPKPFKDLGKEGVLAYIGDSTNAQIEGYSGSEEDVSQGLSKLFKQQKGRIAVTIFASNVGRIRSIAKAAEACGRSVALVGRSLHRMVGAARECGYLDDIPDFVTESDLGFIPHDQVVLICTGSQGESRAALSRISQGNHDVRLQKGDTVIFSARAIPGNETDINKVKNNLAAGEIKIITPDDTKLTIHVSGHPRRGEITEMLQWLKPNLVVPVHGERVMLEAQAELAGSLQVPHTVIPYNGAVVRLAPEQPEIIDYVSAGTLAVESKRLLPTDHRAILARRKLQYTGVVHASLVMDRRGELVARPKVTTEGLIDQQDLEEREFEDEILEEIIEILKDVPWEDREQDNLVAEDVRIGIRRFVFHSLGFKPKATVHVMRV